MKNAKPLDREAFEYIKARHKEGANYTVIAEELMKLGYTSRMGCRLEQVLVSKFMLRHGYRITSHGGIPATVTRLGKAIEPGERFAAPKRQATREGWYRRKYHTASTDKAETAPVEVRPYPVGTVMDKPSEQMIEDILASNLKTHTKLFLVRRFA